MTYELAKKLKDAGFSQKIERGDVVYRCTYSKEYESFLLPVKEKKAEEILYTMYGIEEKVVLIDGKKYIKHFNYDKFKKINEKWEVEDVIETYDDCGDSYAWWEDADKDDYIKIPYLSELIEACGGEFLELKKDDTGFKLIMLWAAFGKTQRGDGKTPEEAVAHLLLELSDGNIKEWMEKNIGIGKETK